MLIAFILFFIVGCDGSKGIDHYEVAIIETTSNKKTSLVTYYDENLEKVGSKSLDYAELGNNFYSPIYQDNKVYIVPRGLQGEHNEKKVISMDLKTGEDAEYNVNKTNIICTAVNKNYLFTSSNLNAVSYLTRTDFKSKEEKELTFNEEYLSLIVASDEYIFAFLSSIDDKKMYSKIDIFDVDTLKLKKEIDITAYGINQTKYYLDNENLYFANAFDKNDQPTNILGILNLKNFTLKRVTLKYNSPDDIQFLNENRLLISCTDVVQSNGTNIIIYEIDTGNQFSYNLNIPILNIKLNNDKLYVLSSENILYKYEVTNDFKLIKSIEHNLTDGVYCSTFFVNTDQSR